jgi:hypothetical protein
MTTSNKWKKHPRLVAAALGVVALVGAATTAPSALAQQSHGLGPDVARHRVVLTGLDNPRQLTRLAGGDFLIAQAGHGANDKGNCSGSGGDATCVGITGKVTRLHHGRATRVMTGLLSAAGPDGTFAVGSDGAGKIPGGPYYAVETYAPPEQVPPGLPAGQLGRLLAREPGGKMYWAGNISAFERRADPDGEGFDSNPYGVLVLKNRVLVADAAGDYVAQVRDRHVSLWAAMQEYGPKVDPVPTTIVKGHDGNIYVGELHSEIPRKAHVWQYDRSGNRLRGWPGFTTVTGVAVAADGTMYVSELMGGNCGFDQIPKCFPGRIVKVAPDGTRTHVNVPFPAGIATYHGHVWVNAFSVSPWNGFAGNKQRSGQLWEIYFG